MSRPKKIDFVKSSSLRFFDSVKKTSDQNSCWEWIGSKSPKGYGIFNDNESKMWRAHRYMYILEYGLIPDGKFVLHHCDNPGCVRPEHLWIGTAKDNARDRDLKGRARSTYDPSSFKRGKDHWTQISPEKIVRGSRLTQAKLTETEVADIKKRWRERLSKHGAKKLIRELSGQYLVSFATVEDIVYRYTWTHVP